MNSKIYRTTFHEIFLLNFFLALSHLKNSIEMNVSPVAITNAQIKKMRNYFNTKLNEVKSSNDYKVRGSTALAPTNIFWAAG